MKSRISLSLIISAVLFFAGGLILASATGPKASRPVPGSGSLKTSAPAKSREQVGQSRAAASAGVPGQSVTVLPDGRLFIAGGEGEKSPLSTALVKDLRSGATAKVAAGLRRGRAWHSATMLPDGNILILGGVGAGGAVVDAAELFNPETQQFELLPSTGLTPRAYHTATLLTDGRVLVAGGLSEKGRQLSKVELWDPRTKTASTLPSKLQLTRQKHRATLLPDGGVMLWGGFDNSGAKVRSAEVFDPASQTINGASDSTPPDDGGAPYLIASLPENGTVDVPVDGPVALRFSAPVKAETLNGETLTITGPQGVTAAKIVPAEGGMLAFLTPREKLQPGTNYTLQLFGPVGENELPLSSSAISFTTAGEQEQEKSVARYDDEDWLPSADNLRGNWRSKKPDSRQQALPPLQAAPGVTALAGQVLLLNGKPLANVTLQVGDKTARTDDTGRFLLTHLAQGRQVLRIDGRTASRPGKAYGFFRVGVNITVGKTNALGFTIWMPKLDTAHAVKLASPTTSEVSVTNPQIPGLELRLPPQTIIRDIDGRTVTKLSITPIPTNQPPFPLPVGVSVPVFFTIQPGGSRIIPPRARLIYPNFTNERPGTRIDFWNYEPEEKGWYIYGQGTVSADGRQVIPDPGVVLYELTGAMVSQPSNAPRQGPKRRGAKDGDPVDLATGLFVYNKTDLALPGVVPITLSRTYRQQDTVSRPFGIGMTHPYEIFLVGDYGPWTYVDLILPDGGRIHYDRISPGTNWGDAVYEHTASPTEFYKSQIKWNGNGWDLTLKNGTVFVFPESEAAPLPRYAALTGVRDRYGNVLNLTRDANKNLTRISSPSGRWMEFTYDSANRITQARDNAGRTVGYEYDSGGRMWKVTDVSGGVTEYGYDSLHRMLTVKDPRGIVYLTNEYDADDRIKKQTQADGTTYLFDYTFDSGTGTVTQTDVTDPRGNVRRVTFNPSGYPLTDTYAVGKPEQQTITYERQAVTNKVLNVTDPLGRKTTYAYDSMGNLTDVTRFAETSSASTTHLTYDTRFNEVATVTDPLQHATTFVYDERGNLSSTTDPLNHQSTFTYNSAGQMLTATDPLGHTAQFVYDSGDLVEVRDPLSRSVTMFFDGAGRVVRTTDPAGRATRYEYDAFNQVKKTIDALGGMTSFAYDPNGNLLSVTDARGKVTSYTYDQMDRPITRTDPLQGASSVASSEYDEAGRLKKVTDRRGKVTTYAYDNLGRLKFLGFGTTVSGGVTSYESSISYTLDAYGRITQAADTASGTITRSYNDLARTWSETTPQGTVGYSYDAAGRLVGKTVTGQSAISYAYDGADRLTGITQGASVVGFGYDDAGRRVSLTLPNGVVTEYGYDAASQLTSLKYKNGGVTLGGLAYEYDDAGRRAKVGGSFARTSLPNALTSSSHDDANRLTQRGAATLTYDASGNLTSDGANTYTWDARGQLASISGAVSASFQYDAFGRRTSKTVNGQATAYLYDGANVAQEQTGGAASANMLTGSIDEVFQRTDASGTRAPLNDAGWSTLALSDGNGAVRTEYTYDPFGTAVAFGDPSSNASQYTGRENDQTGLYNYRNRYYSPALQRFISEDPIGFEGGDVNVYAYVANDPVNSADPMGLSLWRTIFRVFSQEGKLIKQVNELKRGKVLKEVGKGLEEAGEHAIVKAENEAARDALAKGLSGNGKMRGPEKHPGYPEHVHPDTGPHSGTHVQTAPPGRLAALGMLLAPQSITLSGRKDVTDGQFLSAALWDIASGIDPICITDAIGWYYDID